MRFIVLILLAFTSYSTLLAQPQDLQYVEIGINGLHCSACSFTVEKALKKVDGVTVVQMDLNERQGKVYIPDQEKVNLQKLAKAVKDAGYSVRFLKVHLKRDLVIAAQCDWKGYCFLESAKDGTTFQVFGEAFLPKKEWKRLKPSLAPKICQTCETDILLTNL